MNRTAFPDQSRVVLVSGAGGFVGANLSRRLLCDGHEVHLLLRRQSDPWRLSDILADTVVHEVDLADMAAVAETVGRIRPRWIFHLAAHGAYPHQTRLDQMAACNLMGTHHLLSACMAAGFESFIHTGSSSEYGYKPHAPDESERIDPNSHYAVTKAAATLLCSHEAVSSRLPVAILRLYSVYGPWEAPERLMPTLILHGLQGRLPPLVDPSVARDFVHVDDVVEAYILAARHIDRLAPGEILNVGSGIQTRLGDLIRVAREIMAITDLPVWGSMENRRWDTDCWLARNERIQNILEWSPRLSLADGFRQTVNWFRNRPEICAEYRRRRERGT